MGKILAEVELIGTRKNKKIIALFDSGADGNYIRRKLWDGDSIDEIGFHMIREKWIVELADGNEVKNVRDGVSFKAVMFRNRRKTNPVFIVMDFPEDMILGWEFMQEMGLFLDFTTDNIFWSAPGIR